MASHPRHGPPFALAATSRRAAFGPSLVNALAVRSTMRPLPVSRTWHAIHSAALALQRSCTLPWCPKLPPDLTRSCVFQGSIWVVRCASFRLVLGLVLWLAQSPARARYRLPLNPSPWPHVGRCLDHRLALGRDSFPVPLVPPLPAGTTRFTCVALRGSCPALLPLRAGC